MFPGKHGESMSRNDTEDARPAGLPMVIAPQPAPPGLARPAPPAAFLSQLIAARHQLPPQRARLRAPLAHAVDAYATGGRVATRRLPAGYRKSVVA